MHLMREFTQLSFPQIGEIMGGRDHTTVMYGTEKFQERMEQDPELKKRLEKVRVRLQI
jgi:chromosomal replication initiator protein